jgi:hypothetical protein
MNIKLRNSFFNIIAAIFIRGEAKIKHTSFQQQLHLPVAYDISYFGLVSEFIGSVHSEVHWHWLVTRKAQKHWTE